MQYCLEIAWLSDIISSTVWATHTLMGQNFLKLILADSLTNNGTLNTGQNNNS